jgi:hypothetical protein
VNGDSLLRRGGGSPGASPAGDLDGDAASAAIMLSVPTFRRRRAEQEPPPPTEAAPSRASAPPSRYADTVTVVVRHTPKQWDPDPDYEIASVVSFGAGGDVEAEEVGQDALRWLLDEARYANFTDLEIRRRRVEKGASGADVQIVLSLLGGVADALTLTQEALSFIRRRLSERPGRLTSREDRLADLDWMRTAASRAFDIRPSDLQLVEQRASERHHAAVFEDRAGRFYGVRVEAGAHTIRRLKPGDW